MIKNFIKKPVAIQAVQYTGHNYTEIRDFVGEDNIAFEDGADVLIHTLEGRMHVSIGDWIIRGVAGEFYPCKPDIFSQTYREVYSLYWDDERECIMQSVTVQGGDVEQIPFEM